MTTAHVTCPLCEATCGLEVTLDANQQVTRVKGDDEDVFSRGYICPKGASLGALHHDPDRLTAPLLKRDGEFVEVSWQEAYDEIARRLPPIIEQHGRDAVAVYAGNPGVHNIALTLYGRVLYKALGTKNFYSATSVDQMPKHYSAGTMFGDPLAIPVPDLDRTRHLLILGANPLVSNGSLMTAPDIRGRLRGIRERGGKIVVVDPRVTRTARFADEHHAIRPGTDALLLFALVNVLFAENLVDPGRLTEHLNGLDDVRALAEPFTPEAVAPRTGIDAEEIRRMARELTSDNAVVYGRIGTTTQAFGTVASWLVDVLNVLTGHLDAPGGAMFPLAACQPTGNRRPFAVGRWHSRARGYPEVVGELPVATLADEIETPGEGQVRALITVSGNPCLSTPNAGRLAAALETLDFMISVDVYLNETSRQADVILPGPSPLERPHFDLAFYQLSVRNVANWTPATLPSALPQEWETMLRLTGIVAGQGPEADVAALDDFVAADVARRAKVELTHDRTGPARLVDLMLRAGPYDVTLADLEAAPHGMDFGPLKPRIPEVLCTASGRIELAPAGIVADVPRLREELAKSPDEGLVLIGRRHLSSNNSWMHNLEPLVRGGNRCTIQVHPADATRLGLTDGGLASVTSRAGKLQVPVEVTDDIRPGVVSIPHGWGHDVDGSRTRVARAHPGVNSNLVADETLLDVPSGTSVLNGIPVEVTPV
ncbi:molybdopterin-dependent oxidoreductase [Amycolatopsis sp. NPDC051102]|uniref:molybdopterin-dependent oxidoreductase n=1 Tax=Amycolatopsis sp. NPDC051102 TaxID=3155163 RepID=UPI0034169BB9